MTKQATNSIGSFIPYFILTGALILLLAATGQAQEGSTPNRGFNPGGSYALGDFETVNTTNGNLMIHLSLAKLPPGRAGLSAALTLLYNSKLYDTQIAYQQDP